LIGGGALRPGELSLAHLGVLFLDELPEFARNALEALREPLESGVVVLARAKHACEFPARFQLIAATNPCPCGYAGDPRGRCRCTAEQVSRYRSRISGPLIDRIDMHVELAAVPVEHLMSDDALPAENSAAVAARAALHARSRLRVPFDDAAPSSPRRTRSDRAEGISAAAAARDRRGARSAATARLTCFSLAKSTASWPWER